MIGGLHRNYDNPFYSNHVFKEFDLDRVKISFWEYPFLWFRPTYVQISDGYSWHFKRDGSGRYFLMKAEKLKPIVFSEQLEDNDFNNLHKDGETEK